MPPDGPDISMPNVNDLAGFLDGQDGTDQQDAVDTFAQAEQAVEDTDDTPEPEPQGDTFDRKYVEKLRRENASYRERAKKWENVFEGYEEGAVEEWKQMISTFKGDPKSVAEQWAQLSETILAQFTPQEQAEIHEAMQDAGNTDTPLTMSQLQEVLAQKEQEWELNGMVEEIESEARELGYNLKSRDYKILLMTAQELPSGSIAEAHALLEGERQRYFDERIAELEKQGGGYRAPSSKVGVPSTEKNIKDFKDAKAALSNYLDANFR